MKSMKLPSISVLIADILFNFLVQLLVLIQVTSRYYSRAGVLIVIYSLQSFAISPINGNNLVVVSQ